MNVDFLSLIFRYTRNLPFTSRSLIIKSRICQLVVTVSLFSKVMYTLLNLVPISSVFLRIDGSFTISTKPVKLVYPEKKPTTFTTRLTP